MMGLYCPAPVDRLALPEVTLCAVSSVNVKATIRALEACVHQIAFASCKLFTDEIVRPRHPEVQVLPISRLGSSADYSNFILSKLASHLETSHCLIAQWDGHVLDARRWRPEFLQYDYIGASWPQFNDGHDVGNGGFSLRSRRLMEACQEPNFRAFHPEDLAIGRTNRTWLESRGMRFAPRALADIFAAERAGDLATSFGYHGVFNMPGTIGVEAFWEIYRTLDDLGTLYHDHDFAGILKIVGRGRGGAGRVARMVGRRVQHALALK
jgi:hypothetical protein